MAEKPVIPHPLGKIREADGAVADGFLAMRKAIAESGPLDSVTLEYIYLGAFATVGSEDAVKIHAGRLLDAGQPPEAVLQCVLNLLGATATMVQVSQAVGWIRETVDGR